MFDIEGKVALITGGAGGIGFACAEELLRNGLKGVTLADVNEELGYRLSKKLQFEFGAKKAIFVKTDVTNNQSLEDAFKKTIETYTNLDIVINNAGIGNDSAWEKEIEINLNGVMRGAILGLDTYIPKHKSGEEGVIINMASIWGINPDPMFPVYSATKSAVVSLSVALGNDAHYLQTHIKVLALCPGVTETALIQHGLEGKTLGPRYELFQTFKNLPVQKPESVAAALVEIIKNGKSGTAWVVEDGQKPYEYITPPRSNFALTSK